MALIKGLSASSAAAVLLSLRGVLGHDHHGANMNFDTGEPIDGILKTHIIFMSIAFGAVFPVGVVLGIRRNKWHAPVQGVGGILAAVGFILGHTHKGRSFPDNAHSKFSWVMLWLLVAQIAAGVYLKLHTERRFNDRARPVIRIAHKVMAIVMMFCTYTQVLLGAIAWLGYCYGGFYGQCLAHLIMGSSFFAYGIWLLILLRLAGPWLANFGRSPEMVDSVVIMVWGLFNTFTEHGFVEEANGWSHKDLQHTMLGVIWFCGGLLSTYMLRKSGPSDRSMFPAIILVFTGCAMAAHEQDLAFSTSVHFVFGLSLVLAGISRCIEIMLLTTGLIKSGKEPNPFQYIPVFFLCHSGIMFMASNKQNVKFMNDIGIDIGTFSLAFLSVSFLLFLYFYFMMQLYSDLGKNEKVSLPMTTTAAPGRIPGDGGIQYQTLDQDGSLELEDDDEGRQNIHVIFDADDEGMDAAQVRDMGRRPGEGIEMDQIRRRD